MPIAEQDWKRAVDLLTKVDEVALACHIDPDGDALGSMLALQRWFESRGVRTTASWAEADADDAGRVRVPPMLDFLPGVERLTDAATFPARPEVMVAFDTGVAARLGALEANARAAGTLVLLDHHAIGMPFGDIQLVDGEAAATVVLVDELITRMGGHVDVEMATCLYTGLLTDTGRFSYASTDAAVLRFASRLLDSGIDHAAINRRVYETSSFGYLKVLGRALERAQLRPEVGLAWMAVTQDDLRACRVSWEETEGFIDVLRRAEAATCTLVAKEQPDGRWKVSMRSQGGIDVGDVARQLGGGGHRLSSALVTTDPPDRLVDQVVAELRGRGRLDDAGGPVASRQVAAAPAPAGARGTGG